MPDNRIKIHLETFEFKLIQKALEELTTDQCFFRGVYIGPCDPALSALINRLESIQHDAHIE